MQSQPFVGVCGIQTVEELYALEDIARLVLPGTGRFLMAGVKDPAKITSAVKNLNYVRPFIHCDYVDRMPYEEVVSRNISLAKDYVCGLQLNVLPWESTNLNALLYKLKREYPGLALMLQAHRLTLISHTPSQIAQALHEVPIDYLLFDSSQSRGIVYSPSTMESYVRAVQDRGFGAVVAGGLGGETVASHLLPLLAIYPDISCDAFGRLQNQQTESLDWLAVSNYLSAWRKVVRD